MIVTIDGPTASGKSTIAQLLAVHLGFYYINSGLLYRAYAYILIHDYAIAQDKLATLTREHIQQLISSKDLVYTYEQHSIYAAQVFYKTQDLTYVLKNPAISQAASILSTNQEMRSIILTWLRSLACTHDLVIDGRDTGTVVFPQARYKFFMTADLIVRALRFLNEQRARSNDMSFEHALEEIKKRDMRDRTRAIAPLSIPKDAIIIDTSDYSPEQAVHVLVRFIKEL